MTGKLELRLNREVVANDFYRGEKRKEQIINGWRKLYGRGFFKAIVLDLRDVEEEKEIPVRERKRPEKLLTRETRKYVSAMPRINI